MAGKKRVRATGPRPFKARASSRSDGLVEALRAILGLPPMGPEPPFDPYWMGDLDSGNNWVRPAITSDRLGYENSRSQRLPRVKLR